MWMWIAEWGIGGGIFLDEYRIRFKKGRGYEKTKAESGRWKAESGEWKAKKKVEEKRRYGNRGNKISI